MSRKSSFRQTLAIILSLCLMLSSYSIVFGAEKGSDIKGHWAEAQINNWINKGLITGYDDGSFKPNNTITRGEFTSLVNRSFGFTETADINFLDLKSSAWVYVDVQKAVKAGYIKGYDDQTIRVSNTISRQEAAVVIASLLKLTGDESAVGSFSDASTIAPWSKGAVGAVDSKGIVSGYNDNSFKPAKAITRAEVVVMLDKALQAREVTFSAAGTHGPAAGINTVEGNVAITAGGVILQNTVINGNLLLADSIGNGDVFLNNVTVKGTTTVKGGGTNSVHFKDSVLVTVIVDKKTGDIRIVAEGSTIVKEVTLKSGAKLESKTDSGSGFGTVSVTNLLPKDSVVTLLGSFDSVDVASSSIRIELPEGSIKHLSTTAGSEGVSLNLGKDAKIVDLVLEAVLKVLGQGTIENATVSEKAKDSTFEQQPKKVKGNGAPPTSPFPQPVSPPSNGGGNGGGGGIPTVYVSSITVTGAGGATTISARDGTLQMSSAIVPSNATNKTVTWLVDNGHATINAIGLLTAVSDGTVTVTATANDGSGVSGQLDITISNQTVPTTTVTLSQAVSTSGLVNQSNLNAFMTALWGGVDGNAETTVVTGVQVNKVFTVNGSTLNVDAYKVTDGMKQFILANYGGSSVPVNIRFSSSTPASMTTDANWDNAYLIWVDTGNLISGTVPVNVSMANGTESSYSITVVNEFESGQGTISDPYIIKTPFQLNNVRNHLSSNFILGSDIDLGVAPYNQGEGWVPIALTKFQGSFNGNGHIIRNLFQNRPTKTGGGLIGVVGETGKIDTVKLENVTITSIKNFGGLVAIIYPGGIVSNSSVTTVQLTGVVRVDPAVNGTDSGQIGGLVGFNYGGTVKNSSASNVTINGKHRLGGLVGNNWGLISHSHVTRSTVTGSFELGGLAGMNYTDTTINVNGALIETSYADANVYGTRATDSRTGGLVGDNTGMIANSYAIGNVTGTNYVGGLAASNQGTIQSSYAANTVTAPGATIVGGITGQNVGGNVIFSFYDSWVTTQSDTGKGDGKLTSEMQTQSTFTGWDFGTIWMLTGQYPQLR